MIVNTGTYTPKIITWHIYKKITNKSKSNSKEREKDDSINSNNKSYKKIESKAIENMQRNLFFKGNKERQRILNDRQCSSLW